MRGTLRSPESLQLDRVLRPEHGAKTDSGADGENQGCRDQSSQVLPGQERLAAGRREKPEVQGLVQHLAAEQVHENAEAAEKDRQSKIEELKNSREDAAVFLEVDQFVGALVL